MKIRIEIGDDIKLELPLPGEAGPLTKVTLVETGMRKIQVIKEIRTFTGLPLKEAKEKSETYRAVFTRGDTPRLDGFAAALLEAGARIETERDSCGTDVKAVVSRILQAIGYLPDAPPTVQS